MKKIIFVALITILPLVITGCGEKNLECSKIEGNNTEKFIATVKDNKIIKVTIEEIEKYDDLEELEKEYSSANSSMYLYKLLKGVDSSVTKSDNTLNSSVTIDLNKAGRTIMGQFLDLVEFTPDAFISYVEKDGFTCNK